jgi:4-hydroxybenzoate polyprenyltransferase
MVLFFTLFFWEIGGQNIPNDCADIEEDRRLKARTFPVCYGLDTSGFSALITLSCAIPLTLALLGISRLDFSPVYYGVVLGSGIALLILPALRFYKTLAPSEAMQLFNRASYYPVSLFAIVLIRLALGN